MTTVGYGDKDPLTVMGSETTVAGVVLGFEHVVAFQIYAVCRILCQETRQNDE